MLGLAHPVGHLENSAWDPMAGMKPITVAVQRQIRAHHTNGLRFLISVVNAIEELPIRAISLVECFFWLFEGREHHESKGGALGRLAVLHQTD